jgi:hypothetical protein
VVSAARNIREVIWWLLAAFFVTTTPGMFAGYKVAGRPGQVVGGLVVPVVLGVWFLYHKVTTGKRERETSKAAAEAGASAAFAEGRRSARPSDSA